MRNKELNNSFIKNYTIEEWRKLDKPKNDIIVQGTISDPESHLYKWLIGMKLPFIYEENEQELMKGNHEKLVLCAINPTTDNGTDPNRRSKYGTTRLKILKNLKKNGIEDIYPVNDFFKVLSEYKFVISPEGQGIDCHRHYEALIFGCIPIVEHNRYMKEKLKGLPVLYTYDYSEITPAYLEKKYEELMKNKYCFFSLFLSSYYPSENRTIKQISNYHYYCDTDDKENKLFDVPNINQFFLEKYDVYRKWEKV